MDYQNLKMYLKKFFPNPNKQSQNKTISNFDLGLNKLEVLSTDNPNNEGHIFIPMINLNPYPIKIKKGERIAQALFHPYLIVDNDENNSKEKERIGGFGSTGK